MKHTIAYVGPFRFPGNSAESVRVAGLSHSLIHSAIKVKIGYGQRRSDYSSLVESPFLEATDLYELPDQHSSKLLKLWRILTCGGPTIEWVKKIKSPLSAILLYGGRINYLVRFLKWCRATQVPPIVDVVEWYDPRQIVGGRCSPLYLASELSMRYYHIKAKNLIVISKFLENHYNAKGCNTIRIPPIMDVKETATRANSYNSNEPLLLAYAGIPGKKDLLNNAIEALLQLDQNGMKVRLFVAGPTPEDLIKLKVFHNNQLTSLPGCILALGRLSHYEALNLVREADFTVLLRPSFRYAQAGFPTKVPESLSVGTPVICNLTSDLGDYIHDGKEGLICRNESAGAFRETLERAIRLAPEQRKIMRKAARAQAERSFDFRNYSEVLHNFIQSALPV